MTTRHTAARHTAGFRQAEATVALSTDSEDVLRHATDTLYAYSPVPAEAARWRVEVRLDATSTDRHDLFSGAPVEEIGPRLHARLLPTATGHAYWISDQHTLIQADRRSANITARCGSGNAAVHWAARLVRQAMTAQLLDGGAVYAHAAAFTHGRHGIVIAGHKGRGKTTTLLAALHHVGGDYVTNDRLLLRAGPEGVVGYPWPAPLRAGIGTLAALPHLSSLVPARLRRLPSETRWRYPRKIAIEPPDFPRLLSHGAVAHRVRPTLLIWPRMEPGRRATDAEAVPADEVTHTLTSSRLFMSDPQQGVSAHVNHWLVPAPPTDVTDSHLRNVVTALAALPCYRVHAGDDPEALAHRLSVLISEAPSVPTV